MRKVVLATIMVAGFIGLSADFALAVDSAPRRFSDVRASSRTMEHPERPYHSGFGRRRVSCYGDRNHNYRQCYR